MRKQTTVMSSVRRSTLLATTALILYAAPALAADDETALGGQEQPAPEQSAPTATPSPTVPPATTPPSPQAEADTASSDANAIVVTGIRASLEDALNIRRNADVILDGVSADDIGSTPDLNLGEALQRIPGVQINRESARRDATISVRGLPGRFTKTTIMGQSVASTARGQGTGNPFGIFDSSIFNGANVIKSFTPDIPSGGLAANVDLRINGALARKEGLVVRGEVGYEETTESFVPSGYLSGAVKLTDTLGVYGTVSYSKQEFRRDTIRVNSYGNFPRTQVDGLVAGTSPSGTGEAVSRTPNSAFAIPAVGGNGLANAIIYPNQIRQFTRTNDGYRVSAAAGVEFEPSEGLSLRVDGIFTRRDLKNANLDLLLIGPNSANAIFSPLSTPVPVGTVDYNDDGTLENVFVVPRVLVSDQESAIGNRFTPSLDQAFAIYPQVNFENDDWSANLIGTYSEARGQNTENQYDYRVRARSGTVDTNGDGIDDAGTGQRAIFDTGLGDWGKLFVNNVVPQGFFQIPPGTVWSLESSTIAGRFSTPTTPPGPNQAVFNSPASLLVAANSQGVNRNLIAIDGDLTRKFENSFLTSITVGGFYSRENARVTEFNNSVLGASLGNLTSDIFRLSDGVSRGGEFVGGRVPGAELDEFRSLDIALLRSLLQPISRTLPANVTFNPNAGNLATFFPELTPASAATITVGEILANTPINPDSGFLQRLPLRTVIDGNYRSRRQTIELFGMAKFNFEDVSNLPLRGNFGVRYVNTRLSGQLNPPSTEFYDSLAASRAANGRPALVFRAGALDPIVPASREFERLLPSANVIFEITPNLVARAAYYETFEAIDLAEFSPSPTIIRETAPGGDPDETDLPSIVGSDGQPIPSTTVNVSGLDIEPRKSKAFDVGLSWYNRPGSVISLGYFRKSLIDDISRSSNFCPRGETLTFGEFTFADLRIPDANSTNQIERAYQGRCVFTNDNGDPQRVRISLSQNNPNTIFVSGFEAQVQQNLDFLPGFLSKTGFVVNFTRVRSSGEAGVRLFNVAEETYNLIGYYEDDLFQARLAYNHQSEIQLQGGSSFTGGASRVAPRGQLDFSGAIKPMKNLEIRGEVFNITRSSRREYITFEQLNRVFEYDGRTYSVSATYRF